MQTTLYTRPARSLTPGDLLLTGDRVVHVLAGTTVSVETATGRFYRFAEGTPITIYAPLSRTVFVEG